MSRIRSLDEEITVTRKGVKLARIWYEQKRPDYPDALKDYFNLSRKLERLLSERKSVRKIRLYHVIHMNQQLGLFCNPELILMKAELEIRKNASLRKMHRVVKAILTVQHALQHVKMNHSF